MSKELKSIDAKLPFVTAPEWAVLERRLIDMMNKSVPIVMEKYVNPDGSIQWPPPGPFASTDALDDAYESFHNWPLLYILGGDDYLLELSQREFDAVTRQFANYDTGCGCKMVEKEFCCGYDWMHNGESYIFFYALGLADPYNQKNIERAKRFAGFYMCEDPEADNYDPKLKLIKGAHTGSMGPRYCHFEGDRTYTDYGYGLQFWDIPGCDSVEAVFKDKENMKRLAHARAERTARGDTPVNLAATSLMANAYLYTGELKYKEWVKEYVDAWIERRDRNNGIIPDNIGLSGEIGEYMGGRWFGGNYGWVWPHGFETIGSSLVIAGENAALLEHDLSYLDLPRSQVHELMKRGKQTEGKFFVPMKYWAPEKVNYNPWERLHVLRNPDGTQYQQDGWFEFMVLDPAIMTHVWATSMDDKDLKMLKLLGQHDDGSWSALRMYPRHGKDQSGQEYPWLAYLRGEYPEYPTEMLKFNIAQVNKRLEFMRGDTQDPMTYSDSYLQARNPVTIEGLVQLTLGAPQPMYNGGLFMTRVRYFDFQRKRPGLPQDVGALVSIIEDTRTVLQLVNLNKTERREVVVQAGAYGEHQFTTIKYESTSNGHVESKTLEVNDNKLLVHLDPGSTITLDAGTERFVNEPSYAFPW